MLSPQENELTFEQAMAQLEDIVRQLESGDLSLDEMVRRYEEGMRLLRFCQQKLMAAEQRVKKVTITDEGIIEVSDFDVEE